ncbi:PREDICTED: uncharacterized protein LOC109240958 [Nicotiana attenuata]|uniref:uncharacterized protein LOC109240958 n=1 Tax=Nicotiana attenuata TaxID=49451 RepID=UPI000904E3DA|nr:PREDICTED: uncharacterized protein LOC109240958 [Nicotiana attenuata]
MNAGNSTNGAVNFAASSNPKSIVAFTDHLCILQAPSMKRPLEIGKAYDGLCFLCPKCLRNRDVVFIESVFPFTLSSETTSFPFVFDNPVPFIDCTPKNDKHLYDSDNGTSIAHNQPLEHDIPLTSVRLSISTEPSTSSPQSDTPPPSYHSTLPVGDQPGHSSITLRKSQRPLKTPLYLQYYLHSLPKLKSSSPTEYCNSTTPFSLNVAFSKSHHVSPDTLIPESQSLVRDICSDSEPSSYEEAAMNSAWQTAMNQEFEASHANHTWDLVPLPAGKKIIGCKWVYKIKHKADGRVEKLKARLVVKWYTQQAGINYTETFSPVVKMTIVRSLIDVAVKKAWHMSQLDVNNAFLHGDLNEEVYIEVPQGLALDNSELVCKLNKSLYGLKASKKWYAKLTEALCSRGYAHSMYDYSLLYKKTENSTVYIAMYVDDIMVTGTDIMEIEELKAFLNDNFKIKDLG